MVPLSFEYEEETIQYEDFYDTTPSQTIDSSFIDGNADRIPMQIMNKQLLLSEKSQIEHDIIYFHSLEEYLIHKDMMKELKQFSEEEIKQNKNLKSFVNGLLLKYWPTLSIQDIIQYDKEENNMTRQEIYGKQEEILNIYNRHLYIIESEFIGQNVNEQVICDNYSLTILKLNKLSETNNTVHLSKLFSDFELTHEVPFMKLLLNSHDDAFYKLYENALLYKGSDKTPERHIQKN
jgi:hypothetical protein